jgi:hypothetical protein
VAWARAGSGLHDKWASSGEIAACGKPDSGSPSTSRLRVIQQQSTGGSHAHLGFGQLGMSCACRAVPPQELVWQSIRRDPFPSHIDDRSAMIDKANTPPAGNFLYGSIIIPMRRVSAILLIAMVSFSLISPAVFALDANSKAPACCQRGGKHHCTLTAAQSESSSGPSAQPVRCPFFPTAISVPASRTVGLPRISQAVFAELISHPAFCPETDALCRSSYSRAGQKRGPPTFLS